MLAKLSAGQEILVKIFFLQIYMWTTWNIFFAFETACSFEIIPNVVFMLKLSRRYL